jgi:hypothetical protein
VQGVVAVFAEHLGEESAAGEHVVACPPKKDWVDPPESPPRDGVVAVAAENLVRGRC